MKFIDNKKDMRLVMKIADRAFELIKKHGIQYDRLSIEMDLSACHANGNKLRLAELLKADDFNFAHDIMGIRGHLNRTSGKLENCFLPRFSR